MVMFVAKDRLHMWPRSIFILDGVFLVLILGGGRFAYRMTRELYRSMKSRTKRVLIIGAGQSGSLIARQLAQNPELSARVIGFLDDNQKMSGARIHGAMVLGQIKDLEWVIQS